MKGQWLLAALAALGAGLSVCRGALAHDFWIQPSRFHLAPGEPLSLAVLVGHGAERERWRMRLKRITALADIGPDGARHDLRDTLREGTGTPDAELRLQALGLHVLTLTTNFAQNSLPADRFEDYLRDEGLTPAIAARRRARTSGEPGRERYDRRAKALVRIGPASPLGSARATRPVGLSLEITPEIDPYRPGRAITLPVRVTFEGRLLPGALVKLTDLENDAEPAEAHVTDRSARAVFRLPRSGAWTLSVVWTKPVENDPDVDFETTFSSLTFGVPLS